MKINNAQAILLILPNFVFYLKSLIYVKLLAVIFVNLIGNPRFSLKWIIFSLIFLVLLLLLSYQNHSNPEFLQYYLPMLLKGTIFSLFSVYHPLAEKNQYNKLLLLLYFSFFVIILQKYLNIDLIYFMYSTQNTFLGFGGRASSIFDSPVTYSTCLSILCIILIGKEARGFHISVAIFMLFIGGGRIALIYSLFILAILIYQRRISWYAFPFAISGGVMLVASNAELLQQFLAIYSKLYLFIGVCPFTTCETATSSINNRLLSYTEFWEGLNLVNLVFGYSDIKNYGLFESGIPLILVLGGVPLFTFYYLSLARFTKSIGFGRLLFVFLFIADVFVNASSLPGVIVFLFVMRSFSVRKQSV